MIIKWMFLEKEIRILEWSDGSRDTEDWSYDAENSALHHRKNYILKSIQIESGYFKLW